MESFRRYPLNRGLYLTLKLRQLEKVGPLPAEFLRFVYSQEGQSGLVRGGFVPLGAKNAEQELYTACPFP